MIACFVRKRENCDYKIETDGRTYPKLMSNVKKLVKIAGKKDGWQCVYIYGHRQKIKPELESQSVE